MVSLNNSRPYLRKLDYEIPERYRNAFYLANAAFFDSTNWFLHRAYEVLFPTLKKEFPLYRDKNYSDLQIHEKMENVVEILDQCNSIIDVRFPIRRDNGKYELVRAFRSHYGQLANPLSLGGLRIHEGITRDHMKALSLLSSMKNSCLGIGMSGAHGGIKICPNKYSENELKNIVEQYVCQMHRKGYCGRNDLIHPDINTNEQHMNWISGAYEKCSGQTPRFASVGQTRDSGGVENFKEMAALGAFKALEFVLDLDHLLGKIGLDRGLEGKKFIIQGLGKVGKPLALLLVNKGAVCVGVKEQEAYIYDSKGIDLKALLTFRERNGTIENFGLAKTEYPDSIFTEDCDILVLAACHKSLVCYVARDVKAKIIVEAADGPITPTAHKILNGKSKLVVPDIYACAGTNAASYFEYLKILRENKLLDEDVVRHKKAVVGSKTYPETSSSDDCTVLKTTVEGIFAETGQEMLDSLDRHELGLDLRTAAYTLSIKNIFKSIYDQKLLE